MKKIALSLLAILCSIVFYLHTDLGVEQTVRYVSTACAKKNVFIAVDKVKINFPFRYSITDLQVNDRIKAKKLSIIPYFLFGSFSFLKLHAEDIFVQEGYKNSIPNIAIYDLALTNLQGIYKEPLDIEGRVTANSKKIFAKLKILKKRSPGENIAIDLKKRGSWCSVQYELNLLKIKETAVECRVEGSFQGLFEDFLRFYKKGHSHKAILGQFGATFSSIANYPTDLRLSSKLNIQDDIAFTAIVLQEKRLTLSGNVACSLKGLNEVALQGQARLPGFTTLTIASNSLWHNGNFYINTDLKATKYSIKNYDIADIVANLSINVSQQKGYFDTKAFIDGQKCVASAFITRKNEKFHLDECICIAPFGNLKAKIASIKPFAGKIFLDIPDISKLPYNLCSLYGSMKGVIDYGETITANITCNDITYPQLDIHSLMIDAVMSPNYSLQKIDIRVNSLFCNGISYKTIHCLSVAEKNRFPFQLYAKTSDDHFIEAFGDHHIVAYNNFMIHLDQLKGQIFDESFFLKNPGSLVVQDGRIAEVDALLIFPNSKLTIHGTDNAIDAKALNFP